MVCTWRRCFAWAAGESLGDLGTCETMSDLRLENSGRTALRPSKGGIEKSRCRILLEPVSDRSTYASNELRREAAFESDKECVGISLLWYFAKICEVSGFIKFLVSWKSEAKTEGDSYRCSLVFIFGFRIGSSRMRKRPSSMDALTALVGIMLLSLSSRGYGCLRVMCIEMFENLDNLLSARFSRFKLSRRSRLLESVVKGYRRVIRGLISACSERPTSCLCSAWSTRFLAKSLRSAIAYLLQSTTGLIMSRSNDSSRRLLSLLATLGEEVCDFSSMFRKTPRST